MRKFDDNKNPYPKMGEIYQIIVKNNKDLIDDLKKNLLLVDKQLNDEDKEKLHDTLLESIWISRWTDENQESLYAVLTPEEAETIVNDILNDLYKNGFKIVKK